MPDRARTRAAGRCAYTGRTGWTLARRSASPRVWRKHRKIDVLSETVQTCAEHPGKHASTVRTTLTVRVQECLQHSQKSRRLLLAQRATFRNRGALAIPVRQNSARRLYVRTAKSGGIHGAYDAGSLSAPATCFDPGAKGRGPYGSTPNFKTQRSEHRHQESQYQNEQTNKSQRVNIQNLN